MQFFTLSGSGAGCERESVFSWCWGGHGDVCRERGGANERACPFVGGHDVSVEDCVWW